jgi:hypothetical protein
MVLSKQEPVKGAHQGWVFTLNNYTDADVLIVQGIEAQGIKVGKEVGANGTPHLQGAIYWANKDKKRLAGMRKLLPRAWFAVMKGSWAQQDYCLKEGDVVKAEGTGAKQGEREDLITCREKLRIGATNRDLVEDDDCIGTFARFPKFVDTVRKMYAPPVVALKEADGHSKRMGLWVWSRESDLGKTTRMELRAEEQGIPIWEKPSNKWWNGYEGERYIFIDDPTPIWNGAFWGYLKNWFNLKVFTGEVKYGERVIRFEKAIVCANYPPEEYFAGVAHFTHSALESRFEVVEITGGTVEDKRKQVEDLYERFIV